MGQPSKDEARTAYRQAPVAPMVIADDGGTVTGGVNRKKQKRRQKQAARLAAEQTQTGNALAHGGFRSNGNGHADELDHHIAPPPLAPQRGVGYVDGEYDGQDQYIGGIAEGVYYSDEEGNVYYPGDDPRDIPINGMAQGAPPSKKTKRKKKGKAGAPPPQSVQPALIRNGSSYLPNPSNAHAPPPPPPPPPLAVPQTKPMHAISRDRIWNTSTQEERERIKEFWLSLSEEDRRSLVKVEKEAVLRKMKEQQKHSCSCTVCGRKRTAIEEELEVLYDAYYDELEQYANHQQARLESGAPIMPPPPRRYGPVGKLHPSSRIPRPMSAQLSTKGRVEELPDDEEDEEEEFSDEDEDEEEYSDDEIDAEPRGPAADFFNFGNSLTVQGGILTVADDLLKNDGKKFIEMMEQLAERRMQREEEAQYAASGLAHPSMNLPGQHPHAGHNHPPLPDEEEYDEEEDEEYDSQEDEEYDDDEMDAMTEEQRMEEGRRMFQIFAARMFEQRVLTAYREKVAQERQAKLLEELEEESRQGAQREQKRAKEAQKRKDKKRLQKQAKDEERARREAEKAAEEAAARELEEKKAEEQRLKKEEQRKKKEVERKAQEEDRLRKEAEKQRRLQEERERQAEQERKHREQKEREKRKREETKKKEMEEREAKEREAKEKKEREDKVKRREAETRAKAAKEAREHAKQEELAAQQAATNASQAIAQQLKRSSQAPSTSIAPVMPPPVQPKNIQSPHLQIATPAIPKAQAPSRPRQTSQQGSVHSSPGTPQVIARKGQSVSPTTVSQQGSPGSVSLPRKTSGPPMPATKPQPGPVMPMSVAPPPGMPLASQPIFSGVPSSTMNAMPISHGPALPSLGQRAPPMHDIPPYPPQQPPIGTHYRNVPPTGTLLGQPVMNPIRPPAHHGRNMFMDNGAAMSHHGPPLPIGTQPGQPFSITRDTMPTHSHSRQQSASMDSANFEAPNFLPQTQPIGRPAPIQRPASAARQRVNDNNHVPQSEVDDLSNHLGSSALLDDADDASPSDNPSDRRGSAAPAPPPPGPRARFPFNSMFPHAGNHGKVEPVGFPHAGSVAQGWGASQMPLGAPGLARSTAWSQHAGTGWTNSNAFGIIGSQGRPSLSRPVNVRLLIAQACKQLSASKKDGDGYHDVGTVLQQVEQVRPPSEAPVQMKELLDICETEGDSHNGGGNFIIKTEGGGRMLVKYEAAGGNTGSAGRGGIAPGEIGSPVAASSTMVSI